MNAKSGPLSQTSNRPLPDSLLRYLVAFLILPNLLFLILGQFVFLARPMVNMDYLLVGVIWPWLAAPASALLFAGAMLIDFVMAVAPVFHFKTVGLMQSLLDAFELDPRYGGAVFASGLLVLTAITLVTTRILRGTNRRLPASATTLCLGLAIFAADVLLSSNAFRLRDDPVLSTNIATSALFNSSRAVLAAAKGQQSAPIAYDVDAASATIYRQLEAGAPLPSRILLVAVESMGLYREEDANELQLSALDDPALAQAYRIERGSVEYAGSTVPGELRELCRVRVLTIHPDTKQLPLENCLPLRLKTQGYHSVAAHGFTGNFFDRSRWYPAVGFDERLFIQEIDQTLGRHSRCGVSFPGACDSDVADILAARLQDGKPERLFAYWLTLNAHLPVSAPPSGLSRLDCQQSQTTTADAAQCRLVQHHDIVLNKLREIALRPGLPPTLFIVVGDHMPPYLSNTARAMFDPARVPYALLWPRSYAAMPVPVRR